ncbi:hypothetical protein GUK64_07780 [Campylobacter upsaliensis]|nr:hypothetical protein [Campylobacter upsaliensis]
MSDKELEIFELCERLVDLLGDKEAVADLQTLLDIMAKKDVVVDGRNAHTSYTQAQSLDGRLVQKNISSTANEIIPQQDKSAKDFKSKLKEFNTKNKTQTQINIKELNNE